MFCKNLFSLLQFVLHDTIWASNGILFPKFSDLLWEKIISYLEERLKFEAEGREFAKILRSLEQEQFIRTVKGQNNFGNRMLFYIVRIE